MKKVVINTCFGGFSLSPKAVKRIAELKGKECYFFKHSYTGDDEDEKYIPITIEEAENEFMWFAYSVPNPQDHRLQERDADGSYRSANERAEAISLTNRDSERDDPNLVMVVEELGDEANTRFSKLKVVEIPDDVEFTIEEYDGLEHVAEKHQTWN